MKSKESVPKPDMNKEAQRIAIAKACPDKVDWHDDLPYWKGMWSSVGEGNEYMAEFDPLHDLNAMHEAEKVLDNTVDMQDSEKVIYLAQLKNLRWDSEFATASQRAEAFLRTIGKWVDQTEGNDCSSETPPKSQII